MPPDVVPAAVELTRGPRAFHIVAVGGGNMNTIASVLAAMGHRVSGSDQQDSPVLARLERLGVRTYIGHDAGHVGDVDAVAFSAAVGQDNVELMEARRRGIPTLTRAEMLAAICRARRTLAVSGTSGKTTTTAMLAAVLLEAGGDPSYMVGGELAGGRGGARWGSGPLLVVEADESDGTFLRLPADGVVVTSVEADHLDHYGSLEVIEEAFAEFVTQAPGPKVVCLDDPGAARLTSLPGVVTYGVSPGATYHARAVELSASSSSFTVAVGERDLGRFELAVPGLYNVLNATGAVAMAASVGAPPEAARAALAAFRGVGRRFEVRGERDGVTYVDDYAHNPGKVKAVLRAARLGRWRRIVVVFQPHRYTRTAALSNELGAAFADADVLFVTEVYAAGEKPLAGVSGCLVAEAARAACPALTVHYVGARPDLVAAVGRVLVPGDLCLTLGAGDITALPGELLARKEGSR